MINLVLKGEPRSTNNIYKYVCRGSFPSGYMSAQGKAIKESYQWQAKSQHRSPLLTGPLEIEIRLYFGTKRRSDIDNFNKILYDALTGIVWEDDSQVMRSTTEKFYDKADPRIEINIKNRK